MECDLCEECPAVMWCAECNMAFCREKMCDTDYHEADSRAHHKLTKIKHDQSSVSLSSSNVDTSVQLDGVMEDSNANGFKCDICSGSSSVYCAICAMFLCEENGCDASVHSSELLKNHVRQSADEVRESVRKSKNNIYIEHKQPSIQEETSVNLNQALAADLTFGHAAAPWHQSTSNQHDDEAAVVSPAARNVAVPNNKVVGYAPSEGDLCDYCGVFPPVVYCQSCEGAYCKQNDCDAEWHTQQDDSMEHFRVAIIVPKKNAQEPVSEDARDDMTESITHVAMSMDQLAAVEANVDNAAEHTEEEDDPYADEEFEELLNDNKSTVKETIIPKEIPSMCDYCGDEKPYWFCEECQSSVSIGYFCTECSEDYHYHDSRANHIQKPIQDKEIPHREKAMDVIGEMGFNNNKKSKSVLSKLKGLAMNAKIKVDDRKTQDVVIPEAEELHKNMYDLGEHDTEDEEQEHAIERKKKLQEYLKEEAVKNETQENHGNMEVSFAPIQISHSQNTSKRTLTPPMPALQNTRSMHEKYRNTTGKKNTFVGFNHIGLSFRHKLMMRTNGISDAYQKTRRTLVRERQARILRDTKRELRELLSPTLINSEQPSKKKFFYSEEEDEQKAPVDEMAHIGKGKPLPDGVSETQALDELLQFRDPRHVIPLKEVKSAKLTYMNETQTDYFPIAREDPTKNRKKTSIADDAEGDSLRKQYMTDGEILEAILEAMLLKSPEHPRLAQKLHEVQRKKQDRLFETNEYVIHTKPTHSRLVSNVLNTFAELDDEFRSM